MPRGIQGTFTEWEAFITGRADGVGIAMAELFGHRGMKIIDEA
jgi:NAD(P)-dependent dehydrogenase (short-subunit alcohol dehydrogenase family)